MPARRAKMKQKKTEFIPEIPVNSDLFPRLQNISEQTGLSFYDILQKWVLQEESLIGLLQRGKENSPLQTEARQEPSRKRASGARRQKKNSNSDSPYNAEYRKTLVERAAKLKQDGMTLKKIAEIFNEEKVSTARGKGIWYPSSIIRLLKDKEEEPESEWAESE
jgi:hypothetical protein